MGFFDWEITNPTKKVETKVGENSKGGHPLETSTKMLTPLKWGKVTCPFNWTLKCGGLPSWGPSQDHCGVALAMTWVMSFKCWFGFNSWFDILTSYIGAN